MLVSMINAFGEGAYIWTNHAREKMRFYRLTESRIKRIIRHPRRVEEGILEGAVACMQPANSSNLGEARPGGRPAEGKNYSEIWVMYVIEKSKVKAQNSKVAAHRIPEKFTRILESNQGKIKIITAWRYPGKSPERDPVPEEVLSEIRNLL